MAHAGNDHRLGAQEAPPAIISLQPGSWKVKQRDPIPALSIFMAFLLCFSKKSLIYQSTGKASTSLPKKCFGPGIQDKVSSSSWRASLPVAICWATRLRRRSRCCREDGCDIFRFGDVDMIKEVNDR